MPSSTPSSEALEYSFEKLFPHFFISCHSSHKDQLQVSGFFALILLQSLLSLASELSLVSLSTTLQVSAKHAISCPSLLLVHHFSHNFKLPIPMHKATMRNCKKSFTQLTYKIPERRIPGRNEIPKKYGCQFPQHTQWRKHNLRCMYFFFFKWNCRLDDLELVFTRTVNACNSQQSSFPRFKPSLRSTVSQWKTLMSKALFHTQK